MINWYSSLEKQTLKQVEEATKKETQEQIESLKKEWGPNADLEFKKAALAVKEIGGDEFVKYLNETGMGNDVQLIKFAAKAAKLMKEDTFREAGVSSEASSSEDLHNQIKEIMARGGENGYFDAKHPMHQLTVDKVASLRRQITGGR